MRTVPAIWATALLAGALGQTLVSDASGGAPVSPLATAGPSLTPAAATTGSAAVHHYEYVLDDGSVSVYDMDQGQALVQTISLPQTAIETLAGTDSDVKGADETPSTDAITIGTPSVATVAVTSSDMVVAGSV